jgi:hypothetical protein
LRVGTDGMTVEIGTVIAIAAPSVGVIVWLVRLEGRINLADARHNDIKDTIQEIRHDVKKLLGHGDEIVRP